MLSSLKLKQGEIKSKAILVLLCLVIFSLAQAGMAGIFGMEDYPGGRLKAVFEIEEPEEDSPVSSYTMIVEPDCNKYHVTEKITSPGRNSENVNSVFGASGGAGAAGSQYDEKDSPNIDTSPLSALDDRNVEVKPNQQIFLPDGGRLVTQETDEIAGISVVMGTFVNSNYPNQLVKLAFASNEIQDLLLFPPLLERINHGKTEIRIQLVEFSHEK